jgi:hypothetical protein
MVDPKLRLHLSGSIRERLVLTAEILPDGLISRPVAPKDRVRPTP